MKHTNEFVELDKALHDRKSFDCGEKELNTFIQTQAAKHMSAGISKTMLLPSNEKSINNKVAICAFYTIAPSSIKRVDLPPAKAKKLPHYPVPVFLIAQLAVHKALSGQGLGKITLVKALEYLNTVNVQMPAYAVIVDCLNQNAESFYTQYGFEFLCENNGRKRLFLPMKKVNALFG